MPPIFPGQTPRPHIRLSYVRWIEVLSHGQILTELRESKGLMPISIIILRSKIVLEILNTKSHGTVSLTNQILADFQKIMTLITKFTGTSALIV